MVGRIIREYLDSGNRKITIPGFGTFMRKDTGEIIFVDLIRKDDGLLRELVGDSGNYSEVESMALVDRFIFEIKHGIERNGSAIIEGFGAMTLDDKSSYQFNHSPQVKSVNETHTTLGPIHPKPVKETPIRPVDTPPADSRVAAKRTEERPVQRAHPGSAPIAKKPQGRGPRPDLMIIIAIIAAVIALLVIVYGMSSYELPFLK